MIDMIGTDGNVVSLPDYGYGRDVNHEGYFAQT